MLHRSAARPTSRALGLELRAARRATPGQPLLDARAGRDRRGAPTTFELRARRDEATRRSPTRCATQPACCQDFAHLLIVASCARWGVPARYVMGYRRPGRTPRTTREAQATHAWAEVLVPGAGWRGFDPVHRLVANDTYVTVAIGRDCDATPRPSARTLQGRSDAGGTTPQPSTGAACSCQRSQQ